MGEDHRIGDWRDVTHSHLTGFAVYATDRYRTAQGRPVSPSTRRQWLSILRSFFAWLHTTGRLLHNPAEQLPLPRQGNDLPHVLSESEIERLIEIPDLQTTLGIRDRALMETLYATGVRHVEAYRLDLYDVDLTTRRLVMRLGKGLRDRVVPLIEAACAWLDRYLTLARPELAAGFRYANRKARRRRPSPVRPSPSNALWLALNGRRLAYSQIALRIQEHAQQAGLNATVHTFRHSCATHLLRNGASLRHIQQLLGHSHLDTAALYTHLNVEDLKTAVQRASSEAVDQR